jgi:hypothetical protein
MRCYFMRNGHVEAYAPLQDGSDEELVEQGMTEFLKADRDRFDGFEVWRKERCLYRSSPRTCELSSRKSSAAGEPSQDASRHRQ